MIINFFILQLKQTINKLLKESFGLLAAFILIALGLTAISKATSEEKTVSLMKVGVSVDKDDAMSKMALKFIGDYDSVQSICDFVEVDSKDIVPLIEAGELDAAILIPKSFVEAADSGENIPATFYFPDENSGKTKVFKELIFDAIRYIQVSQGTVYTAFNIAADNQDKLQMDYYSIGDYLAKKLLSQWGKQEKFFDIQVVSPFGSFEYFRFYTLVGLLVVLIIQVGHLTHLYDKPAQAVEQYLNHKGIKGIVLSGIRCLIIFIILLASAGVYYIALEGLKVCCNYLGFEIGKTICYPINLWITVGLCVFISIVSHGIMTIKQTIGETCPEKAKLIIEFVVVLGLLFALGSIIYRNAAVNTTGIVVDTNCPDAVRLAEKLERMDTHLTFTRYDTKSSLRAEVANEKIDNGFFITENKHGGINIEGMAGTFSFGSLIAKETIYTQIYSEECLKLLLKEADNIFDDATAVKQSLQEEFYRQTSGSSVLQPMVVNVKSAETEEKLFNAQKENAYGLLSMFAILVLFILLTKEYEKVLMPSGKAISLVLRGKRFYVFKPMVIHTGLVAMAIIINQYITSKGNLMILVFLPLTLFYCYFVGSFFSDIVKYRQYKSVQLLMWMVIVVFMM